MPCYLGAMMRFFLPGVLLVFSLVDGPVLWGQHPGRFVEDQHLRAAVERLEDFHPLLHADR